MNMNIYDEEIRYIDRSPLAVKIYEVTHYAPHRHEHALEILYCLKGSIKLVAGHQNIVLSKGEIFTIDCVDIHCLSSQDENLLLSVYIDLTRLNISWEYLRYVYFACESINLRPYQMKPFRQVQDILLSLAYLYCMGTESSEESYDRIANKLIHILLTYFDWYNYLNTSPDPNEQTRERFHRISSHCQKNYMNKITIAQLAKAEYINENYFSQFLKKSSFQGFSNMLNYIRCFESENLLLTTQLPIAEISHQCGFSDPKYYYRHFKKWWGKTPNQHKTWYCKFMKEAGNSRELRPDEAFDFIQKFIASYHVKKVMEPD